jgi:hypothetical protein
VSGVEAVWEGCARPLATRDLEHGTGDVHHHGASRDPPPCRPAQVGEAIPRVPRVLRGEASEDIIRQFDGSIAASRSTAPVTQSTTRARVPSHPHLTMFSVEFAILAPIPEQHLRSGATVAEITGYVAFGNDAPHVLARIDALRAECPVPVLFHASQRGDAESDGQHRITWVGWYVGRTLPDAAGRHPLGPLHRPPTTAGDGAWKAYYHVVGLRELEAGKAMPITSLAAYMARDEGREGAPVRGVGVVRLPERAGLTL